MKFGKLTDIDQVDFSLPPDPKENFSLLAGNGSREASPPVPVFLGATGWSMKEWVGRIYPPKTKAADFLLAYGKQFNGIELNTTHYRIPSLEQVLKWKHLVPDDFRFCPKIPQQISHSRQLGLGTEGLITFQQVISGLGDQLGPCFLQLPPYFGLDRWPALQAFLLQWPAKEIPLTIEFRHGSWFEDLQQSQSVFQQMEHLSIGTVITDVAGRRDVLHMRVTAPFALVRFVGNGLHPTDFQRADDWVERLGLWSEKGISEVYFFPHQPDNLKAPDMIDYFAQSIQKLNTLTTRGPKFSEPNPQISLFS